MPALRRRAAGLIAAVACAVVLSPVSAQSSRTAEFAGKGVHYVDAGQGEEAIVLIHGWAADSRIWQAQITAYSERFRVIAVDLPAHGKSELPDQTLTMDLFARSIASVMDDADVERAVLVGHSNGTPVVRQFWRLFPERTLAIGSVDGAFKKMFDDSLIEVMEPRLDKESFRETVAGMIDQMPGDGLDTDMRMRLKQIAAEQSHKAVYEGFLASADPAIWAPDAIECPVLLVLVDQPIWTDDYFDFVSEIAPRKDLNVISDVSHYFMLESPRRFDSFVYGFIEAFELLGR